MTAIALIAAVGAQNAFLLRQALRGAIPVWPLVLCCSLSEIVLIALGVSGAGALMDAAPWAMQVITWVGVVFLVAYGFFAARRAVIGGAALEDGAGKGRSGNGRESASEGESDTDTESTEAVGAGISAHSASTTSGVSSRSTASGVAGSDKDTGAGGSSVATAVRAGGPGDAAATGANGGSADGPARGSSRNTTKDSGTHLGPVRRWFRSPLVAALAGMLAFTWLNPHAYFDSVVVLGSIANGHGDLRWAFALGCVFAGMVWYSLVGFGAKALRGVFADPKAWRVLDGIIAVVMFAMAGMLALK